MTKRWFCWALLSCLIFINHTVLAASIEIVRSLGSEGDDLFLHNPSDVQLAADGTWYLLNNGECQVMQLNDQWEEINSFGRCGQGPGEFENAVGMVLYNHEVWVFEMARVTLFGLDGEYLRTLVQGVQYQRPALVDGKLMSVLGAGDHPAAHLNDDGTVGEAFGPECPDDFFESFKLCRNQQILPHDSGRAMLLNPVSGRVWLVDDEGKVAWQKDLVPPQDKSNVSESEDGSSVTMSVSFTTGLAARDPQGVYWFTLPGESEDDPMRLRRTDGQLKVLDEDIVLPEDVAGYQVFFSPDGLVGLVSGGESVIYLCRVTSR